MTSTRWRKRKVAEPEPEPPYRLTLASRSTNLLDRRYQDHMDMDIGDGDLSQWCPPVRDQGKEGSCSAFSGCTVRETMIRKATGDPIVLSPAFLYEGERILMGTAREDSGAELSTTQRAMMEFGVCPEREDPYTEQDFVRPGNPDMLRDAAKYKVKGGYWCPTLAEIRAALTHGHPVQIGVKVYPSFQEQFQTLSDGIVPMPGFLESPLGGHALAAVVDRAKDRLIGGPNSWGADKGDKGWYWLPYEYFEEAETFMDARMWVA